jgi:hypothetical protein
MKRQLAWTAGVLLLIGGVALTGSRGGRAFFFPHSFEYAGQSEYTIFFGTVPIYRSRLRPLENELVARLQEAGYVAPVPSQTSRRELIFHWNDAWRDGYGPLYEVFVRRRRQILQWSDDHPQLAAIYWKEGLQHLRSETTLDLWIGREILTNCWRCESVVELEEKIAQAKLEMRELHGTTPK